MGNLCSSGTERSDKKDETRVPDKPRDGEDEALLPTAGVELGVGPDGIIASVDAKEGVADGGFGGVLGHALKTGESAFSDATKQAKEEGDSTAASAQRCWQEKSQVVDAVTATAAGVVTEGVENVKTAAGVVTEGVENVKTAAEEAVSRGVDDVTSKVADSYQNGVNNLQRSAGEVRGSVAADVTNVQDFANDQATTFEGQAVNVKDKSSAWVAEGTAITDLASESVQGFANRGQETLQSEAELVSTEIRSSAVETAPIGIFENIKAGLGTTTDQVKNTASSVVDNARQTAASVADDAKQTAASAADDARQTAATVADDAKQTAENKINEAVESVKLSASETLSSWSGSASQKVSEVAGNVSQNAVWNTDSVSQTEKSTDGAAHHAGFEKPNFDSLEFPTTQAVQVESPGIASLVDDAEDVIARSLLEQQAEGARVFDDVSNSADQKSHELSGEAERLFDSVQETCSTGFEEAVSVGGKVPQTFSDDFNDAYEAGSKEVADSLADAVGHDPFSLEQHEEGFAGVQETANDALQAAQSEALTNVEFDEEARTREAEEFLRNEASSEFDQDVRSDGDFLDKTKSLLESHRISVDGDTSVTEKDAQDSENPPEQATGSDESIQEATAREFVESIIEKATSLVSESLAQNEPASESSSPSDPVVDRGEETLAPKKRGVMFVSPQISEKSSSSLSSPQEISPPPPLQESDQSALADSSSSSISQGDLVETEELLEPPPLPSAYSVSENNNNNNNNIANNNAEDDDESIHRVAMEVTAKAVQDAIKIVAENGTGLVLSSSDLINNDIGISSPSSPGNDDDELTTTDSSQVERGSPVSDITDTSAHGSVSESLSSYDPGAAFRQDLAGTADLASSSSGSNTAPHPETSVSKPHDKMADLINFEEGSTTHAETPTPTNQASFDTYAHQSALESGGDPNSALPSDVPSSFSPLDELPSSPSKPTIVINSPDSAHHTNGSCEDISSPLTEALI